MAEQGTTGPVANTPRTAEYQDRNFMLATALNSHIGHDNAAKAAKNSRP